MLKFLTITLFIYSTLAFANKEREKHLSEILPKFLQYYHYSHMELNDEISKRAFANFIKKLDYKKQFFLQEDIDKLKQFETKIDDQVKSNHLVLKKMAFQILEKRVNETEKYLKDIFSSKINIESKETFETDPEKRTFSKNQKEHKKFWEKSARYALIVEILNLKSEQEAELEVDKNEKKDKKKKSTKKVKKFKNEKELISEAKKNVEKDYKTFFERLRKLKKIDQISQFYNAITGSYDPHTTYLPPMDIEDFNINMSGKLEGIGAVLSMDGPYTKVERIVPGSPSWKQKELKSGDLILKVGNPSKEAQSIVGWDLRDSVRLIRGPKGTEVKLTVKKPDNSIKVIPIIRDVVELEESYAKAIIIKNKKSKKKIGYIILPSFYRDFQPKPGQPIRNCTDDVAKLLIKLNEKKVDGLIFDLRGNSGGSLPDAIKTAGLFFDKGPVVQVKNHESKIEVNSDLDGKTIFDKPMIILQNVLSASASEIMSGALKDYQRAVVVGSHHTHGKGTVQTIIQLDQQLKNFLFKSLMNKPKLGALKLTISKFFRINGASTQNRGVEPDIVLPGAYDFLESGEKYLDYALKWSNVPKLDYKTWNKTKYNYNKLLKNSEKRVSKSKPFQYMKSKNALIKGYTEDTVKKLSLKSIKTNQDLREKKIKKYELDYKIPSIDFEKVNVSLSHNKNKYKVSKSERKQLTEIETEKFNEFKEKLEKDPYIEEAMNIMKDIIGS